MAQLIKLPNGEKLQFPDGMSDAEMASAIQSNFPEYAPQKDLLDQAADSISHFGSEVAKTAKFAYDDLTTPAHSVMDDFKAPEVNHDKLASPDILGNYFPLRQEYVDAKRKELFKLSIDQVAQAAQGTDIDAAIARHELPKIVNAWRKIANGDVSQQTLDEIGVNVLTQAKQPPDMTNWPDSGWQSALKSASAAKGEVDRLVEDFELTTGIHKYDPAMPARNDEEVQKKLAENQALDEQSYRPTNTTDRLVYSAVKFAPLVAATLVNPELGAGLFVGTGMFGSARDALREGHSLTNAEVKGVANGLLNWVVGQAAVGVPISVLKATPGIGGAFSPAAVDTVTSALQRALHGAVAMSAFTPLSTGVDQAIDFATNETNKTDKRFRKYSVWDYVPQPETPILGALMGVPQSAIEYRARNRMPDKPTVFTDGTVGLMHQNGMPFSESAAAENFKKANELYNLETIPVTGKMLGSKDNKIIGYAVKFPLPHSADGGDGGGNPPPPPAGGSGGGGGNESIDATAKQPSNPLTEARNGTPSAADAEAMARDAAAYRAQQAQAKAVADAITSPSNDTVDKAIATAQAITETPVAKEIDKLFGLLRTKELPQAGTEGNRLPPRPNEPDSAASTQGEQNAISEQSTAGLGAYPSGNESVGRQGEGQRVGSVKQGAETSAQGERAAEQAQNLIQQGNENGTQAPKAVPAKAQQPEAAGTKVYDVSVNQDKSGHIIVDTDHADHDKAVANLKHGLGGINVSDTKNGVVLPKDVSPGAVDRVVDQINHGQEVTKPTVAELFGEKEKPTANPQYIGNATEIVLPNNTALPARWEVVDADQVQATLAEGKNQPRDRSRAAANAQVSSIANNLNYTLLRDSPVMDYGAPTLSQDGAIVGGNGRFEGVSRAYDQGTAADYRARLEADAATKGIDPAAFSGMKKPVLVRRITQPFDTRELAVASNSGGSLQYSALEQAKIDGERMSGLGDIEVNDTGDVVMSGSNMENVRRALAGYNIAEMGSLTDKDGILSQEGIRRIKNALLYKAYGNSSVLSRLVESADPDLKSVMGALTRAAGTVASVREDMRQGNKDAGADINKDLLSAIEVLGKVKAQGLDLNQHLAQDALFGKGYTEEGATIAKFLQENIRSQKRMAEFIRSYYDGLAKEDHLTGSMFGTTPVSKQERINHAIEQAKRTTEADSGRQSETAAIPEANQEQRARAQSDVVRGGEGQQDTAVKTTTEQHSFITRTNAGKLSISGYSPEEVKQAAGKLKLDIRTGNDGVMLVSVAAKNNTSGKASFTAKQENALRAALTGEKPSRRTPEEIKAAALSAETVKAHNNEIRRLADEYGIKHQIRKMADVENDVKEAIQHEIGIAGNNYAQARANALAEGITEPELDIVQGNIANKYAGDVSLDKEAKMFHEMTDAIEEKTNEAISQRNTAESQRTEQDIAAPEALALTSPTEEGLSQQEAAREQARREEEAYIRAQAAERGARDQADIDARTEARAANPDNFQFGENSRQATAPVGDLFNQPASPAESKPAETAQSKKLEVLKAQAKGKITGDQGAALKELADAGEHAAVDEVLKPANESKEVSLFELGRMISTKIGQSSLRPSIKEITDAAQSIGVSVTEARRALAAFNDPDGGGKTGRERVKIEHANEAKEPWQMTRTEAVRKYGKSGTPGAEDYTHKKLVQIAVEQGKPVPAEVLADYPELAKQAQAEFDLHKDGIIGKEIAWDSIPNGSDAFQYALGRTEEGGSVAIFRRRANERGTYGGWRWEAEADKLKTTQAEQPTEASPPQDEYYHYTNGNMGMTSSGSFTADKSRWIKFTSDEAMDMGRRDAKPAYATRRGLFVGTESGERIRQEPARRDGAPIEDFGEHIPGSRKDKAAALRDAVARELSDNDIASMPLSKIWPKESIDQIEDPFVAAVAHAARAEVPAKPKTAYKVKTWVEKVKMVRNLASMMMEGKVTKEQFADAVKYKRGLEHFAAKVALLEQIDRASWDRIGRVEEYPNAYRYDENSKQIPSPIVQVDIDGRMQTFRDAKSVADVLDQVREKIGLEAAAKKTEFEVRGREGAYFINKKGDPLYRKLKTFATSNEALDYKRNNYADLVAAWDAVKESDNVKETDVRGKENRPRSAEDWRKGKDVTVEQFQKDFGFRGGQFGEWVSQGKNAKERQGMLNDAYDAFMDLANIIGVPPKALSLNGSLGIAFGARGSGWASAHYEPGQIAINLTKTRGAGALAHEWFHALDNYFQRGRNATGLKGNAGDYVTQQPENYYVNKRTGQQIPARDFALAQPGHVGDITGTEQERKVAKMRRMVGDAAQWELKEGVRPEVGEAFADLVKALNESPMAKRASLIDKGKSGGYWSRIIERGARSFENYVIQKMMLNGYHNDYLANVVPVESFGRDQGRYPYLLEGEIKPVAEAFDNLFATLKTKETEKGTMLYSRADDRLNNRDQQIRLLESKFDTTRTDAEELFNEGKRVDPDTGDFYGADTFYSRGRNDEANNFKTNEANREQTDNLEETIRRGGHDFTITPVSLPLDLVARGNSEYNAAQKIARIFGKKIVWMRADGDFPINGVIDTANPKAIFIDVRSGIPTHSVLGHELTHHMETDAPEVYAELVNTLNGIVRGHDDYRRINGIPAEMSDRGVTKEIVGDLMGDSFRDPVFWDRVGQENPTVLGRIADVVRKWLNNLIMRATGKGYGSEQFVTDAKATRDALAKAVAKYADSEHEKTEGQGRPLFDNGMYSKANDAIRKLTAHDPDSLRGAMLDSVSGRKRGALQAMLDSGMANVISNERAAEIVGEDALYSKPAYSENYEVQPDTARNLPINAAELTALRRAAAGIEAAKRGITFTVNADGKAIVTGPARVKVPARFQRFAEDHGLTLVVQRANYKGGFSNSNTSMPIRNREAGALYFGEMGADHLDRTGLTRFSKDGHAQAFFNPADGKTYFLHENIDRDTPLSHLSGLIDHEIGVHALKLGKDSKEFQSILRQVELMRDAGNKKVLAAFDRVPADTAPKAVTEEVIGYLVQNHPGMPIVKRIVTWFRNSLRELGRRMPVMQRAPWNEWVATLTPDDLIYMAQTAMEKNYQAETARGTAGQTVMASALPGTFYSQLMKAVRDASDKVFSTGKATALWLQANSAKLNVKKDELHWSGVLDWLQTQGKVSKADVLEYLKGNGVQVQEKVLGDVDMADVPAWWNDEGGANEETPFEELTQSEQSDARQRYADEVGQYAEDGATKFPTYVPPGGKPGTYRELLLTLPTETAVNWDGITTREVGKFASSHYPDHPNLIAHLRVDEVAGANGERLLRVVEIQSDWSAKGRKEGFRTDDLKPFPEDNFVVSERDGKFQVQIKNEDGKPVGLYGIGSTREEALARAEKTWFAEQTSTTKPAPSAPFVTDTQAYTALAIKKAIIYAAEHGMDGVVFATGSQNADLYDLSKQVDRVEAYQTHSGKYAIRAFKGESTLIADTYTKQELPDVIGKDLSAKIIKENTIPDGKKITYSGLDLKVGGSGMRAYYDEIIPQVANKVLRQIGADAKVETITVSPKPPGEINYEKLRALQQPGFPITDTIRAKVQGEGMPLFSKQNDLDFTDKKEYGENAEKGVNHGQDNAKTAGRQLGELPEKVDTRTVEGRPALPGFSELTRIRTKDKTRPLVVYRGGSELTPEHFNDEALGYNSKSGPSGRGVHFTDRYEHAQHHADLHGGEVSKYYVDIRNPYVYKTDAPNASQFHSTKEYTAWRNSLRDGTFNGTKYDGIVEIGRQPDGKGWNNIIAFDPQQVIPVRDEMPLFSRNSDAALQKEIDNWKGILLRYADGKVDRQATETMLSSTPAAMQMLGATNLPVKIKGHSLEYLNDRVNQKQMEQLPQEMTNPKAVFIMNNEKGEGQSFVFMTGLQNASGPILVAIHPNRDLPGGRTNYVATIMNKPMSKMLAAAKEGRAVYTGDVNGIPGMRDALNFGKRNNGKQASDFREAISTQYNLPTTIDKVLQNQDRVKLLESGQALFSRTRETAGEPQEERKGLPLFSKSRAITQDDFEAKQEKENKTGLAGEVKSAAVKVKDGLGELYDAWKSVHEYGDMERIKGTLIGRNQEVDLDIDRQFKKINLEIPASRQRAIKQYMQAGGDEAILRERIAGLRAKGVKDEYISPFEDALKLPDSDKETAKSIFTEQQKWGGMAVEAGILEHLLDNYVRGQWEREKQGGQRLAALANSGILNDHPREAMHKVFQNDYEGILAGYIPVDQRIGYQHGMAQSSIRKAINARIALRDMMGAKESDGLPITMLGGAGKAVDSGESDRAYFIKPNMPPKGAVTADGRSYIEYDHPALRNWKWVSKDAEGNPVFMRGNMWIHPDAIGDIHALLGRSAIRDYTIPKDVPVIGGTHPGAAALKMSAYVKATILAAVPVPFHLFHVGEHAIFHDTNPFTTRPLDFDRTATIGGKDYEILREGVNHGLMLYGHNALQEFGEGLSSGGLFKHIPYWGEMVHRFGEWQFKEIIPRLKAEMFEKAVLRDVAHSQKDLASGKITMDQIFQRQAKHSNDAFGEQNYKYLGRDPTLQDAFKLTGLAPDFLESRMKFAGAALTPSGREQRIALIKGALIMGIGAQIINVLFGDDHKTHWDRPFSVIIGGREYTPRSVVGDIAHLYNDPRSWFYSRLNPLMVRPGIELASGRNQFGQKETTVDALENIVKSWSPIPAQGLYKSTQGQTQLQAIMGQLLQSVGISNKQAKTPAEKLISDINFDKRPAGIESASSKKRYMEYSELKDDYMSGKLNSMDDVRMRAKADGVILSKTQLLAIRQSRDTTPQAKEKILEAKMKSFSAEEALRVWEKADEDERKMLRRFVLGKLYRSHTMSQADKRAAVAEIGR